MRVYMRRRWQIRRVTAIRFLGGKCVVCQSTSKLQFDHIDPKQKSFTIAHQTSVREELFWKEINNCQLLCEDCHNKKTLKELGRESAKGKHGTVSSYRWCGPPKCVLCVKARTDGHKEWRKRRMERKC
jgi:HNH endonuclease.